MSIRKRLRKVPTPRQAQAVAAYIDKGSYKEAGASLGIAVQSAHGLVQRAVETLDLDVFQRQQNEKFIQKTWGIIEKCETLLDRKLDQLLDADKLEKEDATKLSRVIYDLRRSMQGAVTFIQMNIARNVEANGTSADIEGEALAYFSEKYSKPIATVAAHLEQLKTVKE